MAKRSRCPRPLIGPNSRAIGAGAFIVLTLGACTLTKHFAHREDESLYQLIAEFSKTYMDEVDPEGKCELLYQERSAAYHHEKDNNYSHRILSHYMCASKEQASNLIGGFETRTVGGKKIYYDIGPEDVSDWPNLPDEKQVVLNVRIYQPPRSLSQLWPRH